MTATRRVSIDGVGVIEYEPERSGVWVRQEGDELWHWFYVRDTGQWKVWEPWPDRKGIYRDGRRWRVAQDDEIPMGLRLWLKLEHAA